MEVKKRKKLIVVSHTAHYYNENGEVVGWAPTVNELNYISDNWNQVVHLACLNKHRKAPVGVVAYERANIKYVPLPYFTDVRISDGMMVFMNTFKLIWYSKKR